MKNRVAAKIAVSTLGLCAMVTISLAFSFARWSGFGTVERYINMHAMLLGVVGIGLLCVLVYFNHLLGRIEDLESKKPEKPGTEK